MLRPGFAFSKTKAFNSVEFGVATPAYASKDESSVPPVQSKQVKQIEKKQEVAPNQTGDDVFSVQAQITKQQSVIKQLKKDGAAANSIAEETEKLSSLRIKLAELEKVASPSVDALNRKAFDELILRKMYIVPSFEIHNGPAGLFDYGPPACALKANILALWRQHFALEESMLEMECTNLTPSSVLETSGHVERFTDFMVRDEKTGECFRADKLLEEAVDALLSANPTMPEAEKDSHLIVQVL